MDGSTEAPFTDGTYHLTGRNRIAGLYDRLCRSTYVLAEQDTDFIDIPFHSRKRRRTIKRAEAQPGNKA